VITNFRSYLIYDVYILGMKGGGEGGWSGWINLWVERVFGFWLEEGLGFGVGAGFC